jgi:hypothetical protein
MFWVIIRVFNACSVASVGQDSNVDLHVSIVAFVNYFSVQSQLYDSFPTHGSRCLSHFYISPRFFCVLILLHAERFATIELLRDFP